MKVFVLFLIISLQACTINGKNPIWQYNTFDWKLIQNVFHGQNSNIVISPFSVKLLMSLLSHAAESQTKEQLQSNLMPNNTDDEIPAYFADCLKQIQPQDNNFVLDIVTKIFFDENSVQPRQTAFFNTSNFLYNAEIHGLNFKALESAQEANKLFEDLSHGHIKEVISKEHFADALLLLANAIYFQGTWEQIFSEEFSFKDNFYVKEDEPVEVTFMNQTNYYDGLFRGYNFKIVELPYKKSDMSMHIILPNKGVELDEVIKSLNSEKIEECKSKYEGGDVVMIIPKFKISYDSTLKKNLEQLGIERVFTNAAEIPEFLPHELKASEVFHKATIVVDEKGTVATAETVIPLIDRTIPPMFRADHPFAFFIEHKTTGAILFAGKVINPSV